MERRQFRTNIFKALFQAEFHTKEEMEQVVGLFADSEGITKEKDRKQLHDRLMDILEKQQQLDEQIAAYSNGWKLDRLGKAELTILRVAVYEILFDDSVPDAVAVNEAVELAKLYAEDKAPGFINGILGQVVKAKS